ncbi:PDR/VanB family oxidoreductase [Vandammella animalimorsus]|uniref:Oxidoreductase n=1 Tax=Vandammella animalimorsus TaxID=2029117 RepID=A0A2A2ABC6_9BURK|nr:PDR/VanB family oxidoreductase [Vandammella animalimorsus]PAT35093.1 oxidoreductase [Vandammella animalimorsus]
MNTAITLQALVFAIRYEAEGIISVELRPAAPDVVFPSFTPGAHIDLHLGNGLVRSYSLCQPVSAADARHPFYRVGILRDRGSRGGSRWVHESLRVGQILTISAPRNHFALADGAQHSVLVAGGIGVTPLLCMLRHLCAMGCSVEMIYCARNRNEAAFVEEIEGLASAHGVHVHWHFDQEVGHPPELAELLEGKGGDTHYYCCGPAPMLDAFERTCEQLGYPHTHIERFVAAELPPNAQDGAFEVYLERSGKTVQVPAGKSLLDTLLDEGIECEHSCKEGVCGSCEVRVLNGEVEHFDGILTKQEKESNQVMMICVSRAKSPKLILDL